MAESKRKPTTALSELEAMGIPVDISTEDGLSIVDLDKGRVRLPFEDMKDYQRIKTVTPQGTYIPEDMRGKGVATKIYQAMEQELGRKIVPDDSQTIAGEDFHLKKGLGRDFGLSERDLEVGMTPTERMSRNARKTALNEATERLAQSPDVETLWHAKNDMLRKLKEGGHGTTNTDSILQNVFNRLEPDMGTASNKELGELVRKYAKRSAPLLKSIPLVGGVATALMSGDASAAIPILNEADSLGPNSDSDEALIQNPSASQEERNKAANRLKARYEAINNLRNRN